MKENIAFKFLSFQVNESFIGFARITNPQNLKVGIGPKGEISKEKKTFTLHLQLKIHDESDSKKPILLVNCQGVFQFIEEIDANSLNDFFYVNAPAIIFPYLRSYISALTSLSGYDKYDIPIMNLSSLKEILKQDTIEVD